jgi:hypothetical protein
LRSRSLPPPLQQVCLRPTLAIASARFQDVYMNKRTGRIQHEPPENFNEQRVEEASCARAIAQSRQ